MRDMEKWRIAKAEWYQRVCKKRRRDFFRDKFCVDCGSTKRLELDHINPVKKISHNVWSWTEHRREAELAKCTVRCRYCHIERHAIEHRKFIHGTTTMYFNHGCRCNPCRLAASKCRNEARYRNGTRRPNTVYSDKPRRNTVPIV